MYIDERGRKIFKNFNERWYAEKICDAPVEVEEKPPDKEPKEEILFVEEEKPDTE